MARDILQRKRMTPYKRPRKAMVDKVTTAQLRRMLPPPQKKFYDDNEVANLPANTEWVILPLNNGISNTPFPSGKTGYSITMKNLLFQFSTFIYTNLAGTAITRTAPESITFRYLIVYDGQTNNAQFNIQDLFSPPGDSLAYSDFAAYRELGNAERFKVLCDKQFELNTSFNFGKNTKLNFDLQDLPVRYLDDATTGGVANITKGALYFLICPYSKNPNNSGSPGYYAANWRIRYTE